MKLSILLHSPMRRLAAVALALLPLSVGAAPRSVRDLKYEIRDTAIVFPESVQADVHRMQQNWYLQNYTVLDTVGTPDVPATDDVIIQRLHSMPTTIEMPFNQVVRSHIDLYLTRKRPLVETMLGLSLFYMPIFEEALEREGLPLELRYLPVIESAMNPNAVSRAGATGLWQIMLPTARGLGLEINTLVDERRDPIASSDAAVKYLKQLYGIYNDWSLAIAAYNCGPGNVNKALARAGASESNPKDYWDIYYYLPSETRGYVPGFIGATYAMTHYGDHGISPALAKRPILTDTVHVCDRLHFQAISEVIDVPVDELRVLNPQYRKDIIPGDVRPYVLRLPSQTVYNYLMYEDSIRSASLALAPRSVVEIANPDAQSASAGGEGTWREVNKWHKVRRGETLAQVARRYGVSTRQIKRWNHMRSSKLQRGQKLKIVTRQFVPAPPKEEAKEQPTVVRVVNGRSPAVADTVMSERQPVEEPAGEVEEVIVEDEHDEADEAEAEAEEEVEKPQPKPQPKPAATARTHKVVKGDTLYSLSKKYGVTVDDIKKANNLADSSLRIGQRLKIPKK